MMRARSARSAVNNVPSILNKSAQLATASPHIPKPTSNAILQFDDPLPGLSGLTSSDDDEGGDEEITG